MVMRWIGIRPLAGLFGAAMASLCLAPSIGVAAGASVAPSSAQSLVQGYSPFDLGVPTASSQDATMSPKMVAQTRRLAAKALAEQEAALSRPQAVAQRTASLTAYRGLSDDAALDAATQSFGIDAPLWTPAAPSRGKHLVGYNGDHVMRIADAEGRRSLIESQVPLFAPDEHGDADRVSMELRHDGSSLVPENPLVETAISKDPVKGVRFADADVSIKPVGVDAQAEAQEVGGRAFFANVATDTDWMIAPLPEGAETFWQLRSPAAATSLGLDLAIPSDADVRRASNPEDGVEVFRGDQVVATVGAPSAADAQGRSVPVTYELDGHRMTVHVDTTAESFAYPILVDPVITVSDGGPARQGDPRYNRWGWFWTSNANYWGRFEYGAWEYGQYLGGAPYQQRNAGDSNEWYYSSNRSSYVIQWRTSISNWDIGKGQCYVGGLTNAQQGWMTQGANWMGGSGPVFRCNPTTATSQLIEHNQPASYCAMPGCARPSGYPDVRARVMIWTQNSVFDTLGSSVYGRDTVVEIGDDNDPTITATPVDGKWRRHDPMNLVGTISASDAGLGVKQVQISVDGDLRKTIPGDDPVMDECDGGSSSACPGSMSKPFELRADLGDLRQGDNTIVYGALDPQNRVATMTQHLRLDNAGPNLEKLTGALADRNGRTIGHKSTLFASASDGVSGVQGLWIDEKPGDADSSAPYSHSVTPVERDCDASFCNDDHSDNPRGASLSYLFDPATHDPGPWTIRVTTEDGAHNKATPQYLTIYVGTGNVTTLSEGQHTSRMVKLRAHGRHALAQTGVRWQYRSTSTSGWEDIPIANLTQGRDAAVGSATLPLTDDDSPEVTWDVTATPHVSDIGDGDISVRGVFSGGTTGALPADVRTTEDITVKVDRTGVKTKNATAAIGPGTVDLLTGNLAVPATDVSISSPLAELALTRTYNSRDADTTVARPLGVGWSLGVELPTTGVDFVSVRDYTTTPYPDELPDYHPAHVAVKRSDGSETSFAAVDLPSGEHDYIAEDLNSSLSLKRITNPTDGFIGYDLTDGGGTVSSFRNKDGNGVYVVKYVQQAGSDQGVSYGYTTLNDEKHTRRLAWLIAPHPLWSTCDTDHPETFGDACRALHLIYRDPAHPDVDADPANPTALLHRVEFHYSSGPADRHAVQVARYAYDGSNRLIGTWDPRLTPALKSTYTYDSGLLSTVSPPCADTDPAPTRCELPWTIHYRPQGSDTTAGRLQDVTRPTLDSNGDPSTAAQTTVVYNVPRSGTGAPYDLSPDATDAWGQDDLPQTATAVFTAEQIPDSLTAPSSYSRADVYYLDAFGLQVNHAVPGGHITTTEHDHFGNTTRELTASNRERALAASSDPHDTTVRRARSELLDTQRVYATDDVAAEYEHRSPDIDGIDLIDELGPQHEVTLDGGTTADARAHTITKYDENRPADSGTFKLPPGALHLSTTSTSYTQVGGSDQEARETKTYYDNGTDKTGWLVGKSMRVVTNTGDHDRTTRTWYNDQGLVTKSAQPKDGDGTTAGTKRYVYWNQTDAPSECTGHAEWAQMLCTSGPVAQPTDARSGDPALPTTTYTYNALGQVVTEADAVPSGPTRITRTVYDTVGRVRCTSIGGSVDAPCQAAAIPDPGDVGGLVGWWKADAITDAHDGDAVGSWGDSSSGAHALSQATGSHMPAYETGGAGGRPYLHFDGSDWLDGGDILRVGQPTVFVVARSSSAASTQILVGKGADGNTINGYYSAIVAGKARSGTNEPGYPSADATTGLTDNGWFAHTMRYDQATIESWVNGAGHASTPGSAAPVFNSSPFRVGANSDPAGIAPLTGDVAEVIVYDHPLSDTERESVEGYLKDKYFPDDLGTPLPDIETTYDTVTGRTLTTTSGGRDITRAYDRLGRVTDYKDADGVHSTTTYDILGRLSTVDDGKAVTEYAYDRRGLLTKVDDHQFGPMTAGDVDGGLASGYDADGKLTHETLPGGLNLWQGYDETGALTRRCYTRQSTCDASSPWIDMTASRSGSGQIRHESTSGLGSRDYVYDKVGRLTQTQDTPDGDGCTTRLYGFDDDSNRTSLTSRAPGSGGACSSSGGTVKNHSYDQADRIVDSGYTYERFGRTLTVPAADAGGHRLDSTYYVNDLAHTLTQNGVTTTLSLDPNKRPRLQQKTGTDNRTEHYADDTDTTSWTATGPTSYERQITGLDSNLAGTYTNTGGTGTIQRILTDIHGDAVADAGPATNTTAPTASYDNDEFGVPTTSTSPDRPFRWLGAKQRTTRLTSGVITMGARTYVPQLGRFLQTDPVDGGSANPYDYTNQDPINQFDLDGCSPCRNYESKGEAGTLTMDTRKGGRVAWGFTLNSASKIKLGPGVETTVTTYRNFKPNPSPYSKISGVNYHWHGAPTGFKRGDDFGIVIQMVGGNGRVFASVKARCTVV